MADSEKRSERNIDDILGRPEHHTSYGMVSFTRTTSSRGFPLVGSSIRHSQSVKLRISRAQLRRNLHDDKFYSTDRLIEVELSPVQFAEAIINMNTEGSPCTIRWVHGEGQMDNPNFVSKREQFVDEFHEDARQLAKKMDDLEAVVRELQEKPSVSKADRRALAEQIRMLRQHIESNMPFAMTQFHEQVERTVQEAKGEFEAFIMNRALNVASQGFVEQREAPALPPNFDLELEGPNSGK